MKFQEEKNPENISHIALRSTWQLRSLPLRHWGGALSSLGERISFAALSSPNLEKPSSSDEVTKIQVLSARDGARRQQMPGRQCSFPRDSSSQPLPWGGGAGGGQSVRSGQTFSRQEPLSPGGVESVVPAPSHTRLSSSHARLSTWVFFVLPAPDEGLGLIRA